VKVVIFPADEAGCGYHRLIWPAEELRRQGHDVAVAPAGDRQMRVTTDLEGNVTHITMPFEDVDVFVFQRITHRWLVGAVRYLRERGHAVVVDVDDDLDAIDPSNSAFHALHPRNEGKPSFEDPTKPYMHSWRNLAEVCRVASLVTVSSPALTRVYGAHGRVRVLPNVLADHYFEDFTPAPRDRLVVGWPATLHTHPNDPHVIGPGLARVLRELDVSFVTGGVPDDVGRAFMLGEDPPSIGFVALQDWPRAVAELDVAVTPLANTRFNQAKSWLKPLECAAVGVPWIGSPRVEYRRLHELGCGVLAEKPKDWHRQLRRLITDDAWRQDRADAGRAVAATLRLRDHAWRWLEAWSDAVALEHRGATVH
jgi:hypothetical protein